jgi:hypothetical protein
VNRSKLAAREIGDLSKDKIHEKPLNPLPLNASLRPGTQLRPTGRRPRQIRFVAGGPSRALLPFCQRLSKRPFTIVKNLFPSFTARPIYVVRLTHFRFNKTVKGSNTQANRTISHPSGLSFAGQSPLKKREYARHVPIITLAQRRH